MGTRYFALPLVSLLTLGSCAGAGGSASPPPYYNLDRLSYGPLIREPPQSCNPNAQGAGAPIAELSRNITALIMRPLASASQVDPEIEQEGLAGNFKIAGDPGGWPVVIIHKDENSIVFWHLSDLVPVTETQAAATQYCARRGRPALWEGSAAKCGTPTAMAFAVNGQQAVSIPTMAISSYTCGSPDAGVATPHSRRAVTH